MNLRHIILMHPPPAPICWDDPTGTSSLEPTMVQLQTFRLLHAALDGSNDCSKGLQLLQVEPRGNGNCIGDPQETGAHLKWPRRFLKTIATMVTLFERLFPVRFLMGLSAASFCLSLGLPYRLCVFGWGAPSRPWSITIWHTEALNQPNVLEILRVEAMNLPVLISCGPERSLK